MSEKTDNIPVKAFISYSWSSPTHEAWVLNLATRLREDGVDISFDKWDLKPGHDSYQFMEAMVTDSSVTKVIMVCDETYVDRANSREGGVGTESQIISPELYGKGAQDKYAALMIDNDKDGHAHVPVFYKGRIYIDFRVSEKYEEKYEELLRWLVNKPQHVKPKLGMVPESILGAKSAATATTSSANRAKESIRQGSLNSIGLIQEYGEAIYNQLKLMSPIETDGENFDETVIKSVSDMRQYQKQFMELVSTVVKFDKNGLCWDKLLVIIEKLGTLMYKSADMVRWNHLQFDAHKIIVYDIFVGTVAIGLNEECFDFVEAVLKKPYLMRPHNGANGPSLSDYTEFYQYAQSLEIRDQRLKTNRISTAADLIKEANPDGSQPSFESLMMADLILFIRGVDRGWYPVSLVYASNIYSPFTIFARSESKSYFNRVAKVLGFTTLESFKERVSELEQISKKLFHYRGIPMSYLTNIEHLCKID